MSLESVRFGLESRPRRANRRTGPAVGRRYGGCAGRRTAGRCGSTATATGTCGAFPYLDRLYAIRPRGTRPKADNRNSAATTAIPAEFAAWTSTARGSKSTVRVRGTARLRTERRPSRAVTRLERPAGRVASAARPVFRAGLVRATRTLASSESTRKGAEDGRPIINVRNIRSRRRRSAAHLPTVLPGPRQFGRIGLSSTADSRGVLPARAGHDGAARSVDGGEPVHSVEGNGRAVAVETRRRASRGKRRTRASRFGRSETWRLLDAGPTLLAHELLEVPVAAGELPGRSRVLPAAERLGLDERPRRRAL